MALITIIIPTYERWDLLEQAIESALAQTLTDFVVLIGDNSASRTTEFAIAKYDDPRIRYHRNEPSLTPQENWLDLVERSETALVASLHDDDRWDRSFLATVVPPMLEDPSIAMAFSDFWVIDEHGKRLPAFTAAEAGRTRRSLMPSGIVDYDLAEGLRLVAVWNAPQPAYAAVLRREAVLSCGFPDEIAPLYDIWLSYQLIMKQARVRFERRRLTEYRVHANAATSEGFAKAEDEVFRRILAENSHVGEIATEIAAYWASLRWARATRLMSDRSCSESEQASRVELAAAAPNLTGARRLAALVGSRSTAGWQLLCLAKRFLHRRRRALDLRFQPVPSAEPAGELIAASGRCASES